MLWAVIITSQYRCKFWGWESCSKQTYERCNSTESNEKQKTFCRERWQYLFYRWKYISETLSCGFRVKVTTSRRHTGLTARQHWPIPTDPILSLPHRHFSHEDEGSNFLRRVCNDIEDYVTLLKMIIRKTPPWKQILEDDHSTRWSFYKMIILQDDHTFA